MERGSVREGGGEAPHFTRRPGPHCGTPPLAWPGCGGGGREGEGGLGRSKKSTTVKCRGWVGPTETQPGSRQPGSRHTRSSPSRPPPRPTRRYTHAALPLSPPSPSTSTPPAGSSTQSRHTGRPAWPPCRSPRHPPCARPRPRRPRPLCSARGARPPSRPRTQTSPPPGRTRRRRSPRRPRLGGGRWEKERCGGERVRVAAAHSRPLPSTGAKQDGG